MAEEVFDPYRKWLGIPPSDQPPDHYRLLGVAPFEDDVDVLKNAVDRQMTHVRKYQTTQYSIESQQLLNELSAARVCLLNVKSKTKYDRRLRRRLEKEKNTVTLAPPEPAAPPPAPPAPPVAPPPTAGPKKPSPQPPPSKPAAVSRSSTPTTPTKTPIRANPVLRRYRRRRSVSPWPMLLGIIGAVVLLGVVMVVIHHLGK